ncbi:uncharacterized protein MJAP1_001995 [Malassezia japonica]|uniref:Low temperature requirement A n=1 Tax=Malassezia japonica TaxID=223818 RepID=A0AAF0EXZ6_9BASI|nr:uncharacterized protein MJAP1_001995 [Malassezia japonica]WFD39025.1 hypothetical protein MJAP1_001995 [Malassezia japonica]
MATPEGSVAGKATSRLPDSSPTTYNENPRVFEEPYSSDEPCRFEGFLRQIKLKPMKARDPREIHRTASSLELFFDLVFVISVGIVTKEYLDALKQGGGHAAAGFGYFCMIFFTIWWAWMNYTWFATSFDTDDWLYRFLTLVQMAGVLVHAAGIKPAFGHQPETNGEMSEEAHFTNGDFRIVAIGYVIMRFGMVSQWLRAAINGGRAGRAAFYYAILITIVQVLWILWAYVFPKRLGVAIPLFIVFAACELLIPTFAELRGRTTWHPHHITERYGCFTLIQLGESINGACQIISEALQGVEIEAKLVGTFVFAFAIGAGMWWIYFWPSHHHAIRSFRDALRYGYTHFILFMAIAAYAAGVELVSAKLKEGEELRIPYYQASLTVTVPVGVFLLGIWWILIHRCAVPVVKSLVPASAFLMQLDAVIFEFAEIKFPMILTTTFIVINVVAMVVYSHKCPLEVEEEEDDE